MGFAVFVVKPTLSRFADAITNGSGSNPTLLWSWLLMARKHRKTLDRKTNDAATCTTTSIVLGDQRLPQDPIPESRSAAKGAKLVAAIAGGKLKPTPMRKAADTAKATIRKSGLK